MGAKKATDLVESRPNPLLDDFIGRRLLPVFDAAEAHGWKRAEVRAAMKDALCRVRLREARDVDVWTETVVDALARKIEKGR